MATEVKLPELGENIDAGDVIKIMVVAGQEVEKEQPLIEIETDKAALEVPSPISGTVDKVHVAEGDSAKVGQIILTVNESASSKAATKKTGATPESPKKKLESAPDPTPQPTKPVNNVIEMRPTPDRVTDPRLIAAAPSVRRRARELGIDLFSISGSGIDGRIAMHDVEGGRIYQDMPSTPKHLPLPDFSRWGEFRAEPMSKVRKLTAENLANSWSRVPQVTHYDKADVTDLEKLRKQHAEAAKKAGGKLTVTAILLKVIGSALKKFPEFNASVDMAGKQIIYKDYVSVGIAVDTERGLLVPVVRNVDQKNVIELAVELSEISVKARNKKIRPDDMQGGNFTVSNLGGIGGVGFSPIVNSPEVAILGVSRGVVEPRYINEEFVPRTMMPLSLSYDHRLIDGANAARFLRWVCEALEQPALIVMEG